MSSSQSPMNRRTFIQGTAATTGALLLSRSGFGQAPPASEKLRVACIGAGGRGKAAVDALRDEHIVALCDVDEKRAAQAFEDHPKARRFQDWRRMLDAVGSEIDAVTVSTPDHTHFPAAYAALQLRKHVFCEKPLTHSIWEARRLREAAAEAGVVTQMGNQGHAGEGARLLREWVQGGLLGPVREVYHWTDRPIWDQGIERPDHSECVPVVPSTLNWDLWLGTAPERPYDPAYAPFSWRGWWDFGTGALGDMGCHIMDGAYWALDLGAPTAVEAFSTPVNDETAPEASVVRYEFPARGAQPPVVVTWSDGGLRPPMPAHLEADRKWESNGTLVVGERATVLANTYYSSVRIIPEDRMRELKDERPPKTIPRVRGGHFQEWIRACKGEGPRPGSHFGYAGPFTETVLLGNLAIRTGRRVEWDSAQLRATNCERANALVRTDYRPGWGV